MGERIPDASSPLPSPLPGPLPGPLLPPPPVGGGNGGAVLALWDQCGGSGGSCVGAACSDAAFAGTTCAAGASCVRASLYYWQCLPTSSPAPGSGDTPPASAATIARWGQCGGAGADCAAIAGPAACVDASFPGLACASGSTCQRQNPFYYQCL